MKWIIACGILLFPGCSVPQEPPPRTTSMSLQIECDADARDVVVGTVKRLWNQSGMCQTNADCDIQLREVGCLSLEAVPVSSKSYENSRPLVEYIVGRYCSVCSPFSYQQNVPLSNFRCIKRKCRYVDSQGQLCDLTKGSSPCWPQSKMR